MPFAAKARRAALPPPVAFFFSFSISRVWPSASLWVDDRTELENARFQATQTPEERAAMLSGKFSLRATDLIDKTPSEAQQLVDATLVRLAAS